MAIFFRESKFELVEKFSTTYSQAIQELESLKDIKEAVNANETLRQKLKELCQMFMVGAITMVFRLQDSDNPKSATLR